MTEECVLVLCPPNMTAPRNGPNGFLGDRIHQLPAVIAATELYAQVYVWPEDAITRQAFDLPGVNLVQAQGPSEVIQQASDRGVERVFCLYADPSTCIPERTRDCDIVIQCHEIATKVAPSNFYMPEELDPRGNVPLWRRLYATVRRQVEGDLQWPSGPFLTPDPKQQTWAKELVSCVAGDRPVLVVSPLSGAPKGAVDDQWWWALARRFEDGTIIVPVYGKEYDRVKDIFDALPNVEMCETDIAQTAALATVPGVHVLGIDGGRMNVLAAASPRGALCIYGEWPASAWAMPNVVARDPTITPEEALLNVP